LAVFLEARPFDRGPKRSLICPCRVIGVQFVEGN
jgi:hypothetical protein